MKKIVLIVALLLALTLLSSLLLTTVAFAESESVEDKASVVESIPFEDSDVVVEEAPTDYATWIYIALAVIIGGFVVWFLVKPPKKGR